MQDLPKNNSPKNTSPELHENDIVFVHIEHGTTPVRMGELPEILQEQLRSKAQW